MKQGKVIFTSSAGGHYTELMQLSDLIEKYNGIVITEKTVASSSPKYPTKYVPYGSRNDGPTYLFKFLWVWVLSLGYIIRFRPKAIISTGVHSTVPLCLLGRLIGAKIIYIETVAKVTTPTITGKMMNKIATEIYVQWEELLEHYPNAKYGGRLL